MRTILEHNPYFNYARYLGNSKEKDVLPLVANYDTDIPAEITNWSVAPRLAQFGSKIYILGDEVEIALGSIFLRANPKIAYNVEQYETPEQAKERFIAVYGVPYEEFLSKKELEDLDLEDEEEEDLPEESFKETHPILSELSEARTKSNFYVYLSSYIRGFSGGRKPDKAPCLIGHSGIAKSSIVYKVVEDLDNRTKDLPLKDIQEDSLKLGNEKWGYKLIEIRAGFLDKTDLLGYSSEVELEGVLATADSPKKELLLCTTEFVEECRKWLTNFKEEITPENQAIVNKMRYFAKTPVLFLDEVNRCPASIMSQLMIMITSHRLDRYNMDIAPKVCAANEMLPTDEAALSEDAKSLFVYLTRKGKMDIARDVGRFEKLYVREEDESVILDTYTYLLSKFKDVPAAVKALEWAKKTGNLYNHKVIDKFGKFPTFRGWEDLCTYLRWIKNNPTEKPLRAIVPSLLGTAVDPSKFISGEFDESKSMDSFIRHCIDSGLPCSLLGRLSIGKTAKLQKYSKLRGGVVEVIDLSAEDRTTVNGTPKKKGFLQTIFKELTPVKHRSKDYSESEDLAVVDSGLFKAFEESLKSKWEIPLETTDNHPKNSIVARIADIKRRTAAGEKIKLILFFDEFNRAKEVVQSSIFEAVSLKKFRGVSLEGIDYSVVTAGNWQSKQQMEVDGKHYDVTPVDTAMLHRCAVMFIESLSDEDIKDFMDYLKVKHPIAYDMLDNLRKLDPNKLREVVNTLPTEDEEITTHTNIFGFREVTQLENTIHQFDVDLTVGLTSADNLKIAAILESPHYVMYKVDPDSTVDTFWQYLGDNKKLYVNKGDLTLKEFAIKSAELLRDKGTSKEAIESIVSVIRLIEDDLFSIVNTVINDNAPENAKEVIKGMVSYAYASRTAARIASINMIDDILSEDQEEMYRALDKFVADQPSDSVTENLIKLIFMKVKESEERVKSSTIIKLLDTYNKSEAARQSNKQVGVTEIFSRIMKDLSDKIISDTTKKYSVELSKLIIQDKEIPADYLELLEKHIQTQGVSFYLSSKDKNISLFAGYHYVNKSSSEEYSIVPDLYTVYAVDSSREYGGEKVQVSIDNDYFDVSLEKIDRDTFNLTYTGRLGIVDFEIKASNIKNTLLTKSPVDELLPVTKNVFPEKSLDNPDMLVKKNLSSLIGIISGSRIYGSTIVDVTGLSTDELTKLDNLISKSIVPMPDRERLSAPKSGIALLFKKSFSGFERLFT